MPFVTFTVRRGLSAADKSRLSEAMLEAQVTAGYHRADPDEARPPRGGNERATLGSGLRLPDPRAQARS